MVWRLEEVPTPYTDMARAVARVDCVRWSNRKHFQVGAILFDITVFRQVIVHFGDLENEIISRQISWDENIADNAHGYKNLKRVNGT